MQITVSCDRYRAQRNLVVINVSRLFRRSVREMFFIFLFQQPQAEGEARGIQTRRSHFWDVTQHTKKRLWRRLTHLSDS